MDFELFWTLYNPESQFSNRRSATCLEWEKCAPEKQKSIIDWLQKNRPPTGRNPYFFVLDFALPRRQVLSYRDYYARYGTTEPQDGWHMENPTGQQVIFVKN